MPEISYKKIETHLAELKNGSTEQIPPVYLIYGEEMLVGTACEQLLDFFVPAASRSLNYDPIDAAADTVHDIIERVNTFSLSPGIKVVAARDSKIFYARQDNKRLLEKAKSAYDNNELRTAAGYFLSVLGHLNLSYDDVGTSNRTQSLDLNADSADGDAWMDDIITFCRENQLKIPVPQDDCSVLQAAVEKGFPKNNLLLITTDFVDKRRGLFKAIGQYGMVVDCSVPRGQRRVDKMAQEEVLKETMSSMLRAANKKIDHAAYPALYEMTGFDLRTFSSNLEKLIDYVGERNNITVEDVKAVLKRTKRDPIFDLTNAIADRHTQDALFYLNSLLSADFHPLQILAAITNQIRKLLVVKDFVNSPHGAGWNSSCPYNQFRDDIIPAIMAYDKDLIRQVEKWNQTISGGIDSKGAAPAQERGRTAQKRKKKAVTDLLIAKNPKNSYPVYQVMIKSERFTKNKLYDSLEALSETDLLLKSSRQDPRLILEKLILRICQADHQENVAAS
jgi:DNA polymerase-3 subunit delta